MAELKINTTQEPKLITTQNPILLTCRIANGRLELSHEGQLLPDGGLKMELDVGQSTVIRIADFVQENICYRAQAFTVQRDGMLMQWAREENGVCSPTLELGPDDTELRLRARIQAVGYSDATASARMNADYDFSTYEDDTDVWIPKKGSKPTY